GKVMSSPARLPSNSCAPERSQTTAVRSFRRSPHFSSTRLRSQPEFCRTRLETHNPRSGGLSLQNARREQQQTLARILRFGADSALGRDFGLASIRTRDDFRRQLPVAGFDHFAPYIERVAAGETTALFPPNETLLTFTQTSATTGRAKILPITKTWYRYYARDWDVWGAKAYSDHRDMLGLPIVNLSGPWTIGRTTGGYNIAIMSAVIERYQSPLVKMLYAAPGEMKQIADIDARGYCLIRMAAHRPIGLISTVTPQQILQVADWIGQFGPTLIRDLAQGTLDSQFEISRAVRDRLAPRLRVKHPELARTLERALSQNGVLRPKDIWRPKLISCWLGGTVGPTSRRIPELFGDVPLRDQGLLSTEGRHTVPLADGVPYGPLAIGSNYYEFIPADEQVSPSSTVFEAHELETDKQYRIIMTTLGGLYRYDIGDIVKCVGYAGETPLIEFIQKDGSYCDLVGEKLSAFTVCQAAERAQAASGLAISCFTVAPQIVAGKRPRYAVIVETQEAPDHDKAAAFLRAFDADLCANVLIYGVTRKNRLLETPCLVRIPQGAWREYRTETVAKSGAGDNQYKHKPLVADPAFLDRLSVIDVWELDSHGRIESTDRHGNNPDHKAA
ncbi:MAG: GH3 auxin-responsive promoter family protein, partial [Planctomycetaceae bacterium]|nr:GH3 auxin-responsive promoter family protein [Planctomycetaceae bacterium]